MTSRFQLLAFGLSAAALATVGEARACHKCRAARPAPMCTTAPHGHGFGGGGIGRMMPFGGGRMAPMGGGMYPGGGMMGPMAAGGGAYPSVGGMGGSYTPTGGMYSSPGMTSPLGVSSMAGMTAGGAGLPMAGRGMSPMGGMSPFIGGVPSGPTITTPGLTGVTASGMPAAGAAPGIPSSTSLP